MSSWEASKGDVVDWGFGDATNNARFAAITGEQEAASNGHSELASSFDDLRILDDDSENDGSDKDDSDNDDSDVEDNGDDDDNSSVSSSDSDSSLESTVPEWACSYCGFRTNPSAVVKCLHTNKWFCNARYVPAMSCAH